MKEVWQMTQAEYAEKIGIPIAKQYAKDQPETWYRAQSDRNHRKLICRAINLCLPVPTEILEEIGERVKKEKGA